MRIPKCTICGFHDETDAEFDWSLSICEGCEEKGWRVLKSYHNPNIREWKIIEDHLYYTDDNGLSYFYATTAEHAAGYAADVYKRDLQNGNKIRKSYNEWLRKQTDK